MSGATCRLFGKNLAVPLFRSLACAHCLFYIYFVTPPYSDQYSVDFCGPGMLICDKLSTEPCSCFETPQKVYNIHEFSLNSNYCQPLDSLVLNPPLPPEFFQITKHCCEAASKCCENVLAADSENIPKTDYLVSREISKREPKSLTVNLDVTTRCPATWDGWLCFERTLPGTVEKKCPNYIFGDRLRNEYESSGNTAKKECLENGDWLIGGDSEWTDYSECDLTLQTFTLKLLAGTISFSISVISIIPAIFIISSHSALKKQTVFRIHKNLLFSFLFYGLIYLFNIFFFTVKGAIGEHFYLQNHVSCRILYTLQLRYFRLCTFTWMLGEGVYLYRLLMCTFSSEAENLKSYYIFCWGVPLIITVIYSVLRHVFDNEMCWMSPSEIVWIEWTIMGPCLLALCVNLLLVAVILYVLIKKLRYNPHLEPIQYTKAVRAVFMLVPVFGLHFLITIYRIESHLHLIANLVLDGIQGFVVALIVCYTNKTVVECLKKWFGDQIEERKLRRQSEDKRIHFKRSIENSYATERLFLGAQNNNHRSYTNTNGNGNLSHLRANLSRDSDDYEESVNISGMDHEDGHVIITNLNGETTLAIPYRKNEKFV